MRAEPLPQRGVQQVRGRVVRHRREPAGPVHDRAGALALAELALDVLERDRLVVAEAVHVDHDAAARLRLDDARVGHLAAALGVERALLELREHAAVLAARPR